MVFPSKELGGTRTVPIVVEVCQLVVPLRDDPQCVLEEGDDDQESSNGR